MGRSLQNWPIYGKVTTYLTHTKSKHREMKVIDELMEMHSNLKGKKEM